MSDEPDRPAADTAHPGEGRPDEDAGTGEEGRFPGGVESDEGQRPGEKTEDDQPGMAEDPPRAD